MGKTDELAVTERASWEDLLEAATVAIDVPGPAGGAAGLGTGFVMADGVVATCAHVIAGEGRATNLVRARGVAVEVEMTLQASSATTFRSPGGLDLALLRVVEDSAARQLPKVLPGPDIAVGDQLWAFGHPDGMFRGGQPATFTYEGRSRRSGQDPIRLLRARGTVVTPGFSGSPVANRRTGAVCGMICTSSTTGSTHLLPISEILARCEPARLHIVTAQVDHRRWLSVLTDEQLAIGRWRFPGPQLRAYLAMAARAAEHHPYRLTPTGRMPPLSAVYVQQTTRQQGQAPDSDAASALVQPAEVVFDGDTDALLLGGAGAGKSSLFQHTLSVMAQRHQHTDVTDVPVRVQATDLLGASSMGAAIARSVRADVALNHGKGSWPAAFFDHRPIPDGTWVVLVDGIDEVMDPVKRHEVLSLISTCRLLPDNPYRFVIATRPATDIQDFESDGWKPTQYELLAFDDEQRCRFAEGWFTRLGVDRPAEAATQFDGELRQRGLTELARNPLMATMLCQLYVASPQRRLPPGRATIFRDFVHLLRERQFSDADGGIRQQVNRSLRRYGRRAEEAGEQLIADGVDLIGRLAADRLDGDEEPAIDKLDRWTRQSHGSGVPDAAWRALLGDYLRRSGLLLARGDDFVFLHQTIQEFLAAQIVAREPARARKAFSQLFAQAGPGRPAAPPAWRQSYARFLVTAWPAQQDMTRTLRTMVDSGGLDAALFITALADDGHDLDSGIVDGTVRALGVAARDARLSTNERDLAVRTCIRLRRRAGLDLACDITVDRKLPRGLRIAVMSTLATVVAAQHTAGPVRDGSVDAGRGNEAVMGGNQWMMEQLARATDIDGVTLLATLGADATLEPRQRIWAANALAVAGHPQGRQLLVDVARDTRLDSAIRRVAATALRTLSDSRAAPLLRALAVEPAPSGRPTLTGAGRTGVGRAPLQRIARRLGMRRAGRTHADVSDVLRPLVDELLSNHPSADVRTVQQAFDTAAWWHSGQYRPFGDPYIVHPLAVAMILANLGMDATTLVAALLSGTVEHTAYTLDQLRADFGSEVALLVDGVTKLDSIRLGEAAEAESIRKMVVAMAKDPRVLIIKLGVRLHDMRTCDPLPRATQEQMAKETLEILAPLAHRLGMNTIKWELEDLAFGTLFPKRYEEINRLIGEHQPQRENLLKEVVGAVHGQLRASRIVADVAGRPRHLYSIYQKMIVRGRDFNDIYDLVGVRILVDTVRDCYAALGVIHANWQPVPGRLKDYIAMPKFNMYQSLHTTVIGPTGKPVEMQIRTYAMHRTAEFGIAAHWKQRGHEHGRSVDPRASVDDMPWLRQLLDWQREAADPSEFLDALRFDLSSQEVYVFTPKGDVIPLPTGSTPVDFAYAVHTEVGHRCIGARVNGKLVPLESTLSNGDVIEIFTSKSDTAGPTQDWLGFVKSPRARTKIRQYFNKERREEAIEAGKDAIVKAMRKQGLPLQQLLTSSTLVTIARTLHLPDVASLYAAVGEGHLSAPQIVRLLMAGHGGEEGTAEDVAETAIATRTPRSHLAGSDPGVVVRGRDDSPVRLARCCLPVPPDDVFGFAATSGEVSVHRTDCLKAAELAAQGGRTVDVDWKATARSMFLVAVQVEALARTRLLADVAGVLARERVDVVSGTITTTGDRITVSRFTFQVADAKHLAHLLSAVRQVDGVFDAYRVTSQG